MPFGGWPLEIGDMDGEAQREMGKGLLDPAFQSAPASLDRRRAFWLRAGARNGPGAPRKFDRRGKQAASAAAGEPERRHRGGAAKNTDPDLRGLILAGTRRG